MVLTLARSTHTVIERAPSSGGGGLDSQRVKNVVIADDRHEGRGGGDKEVVADILYGPPLTLCGPRWRETSVNG